ncbi:hypothetical protein BHM03_00018189 [Ensete ventricosum]|nr:hypothetical protein BHM03_00018189 [Ensete ventricosum]
MLPRSFSPRGEKESPAGNRPRRGTGEEQHVRGIFIPLLLLSSSIDRRQPKSTADGRLRRYRPVASGPRTNQLSDQYVPLDTGPYCLVRNLVPYRHIDQRWYDTYQAVPGIPIHGILRYQAVQNVPVLYRNSTYQTYN